MDKKYQVFISSTYVDLEEERKEIIQALLELDCIPAGMELFQASNDAQWELIKRVIDTCDYYIVIIAGRYGSIHPITGKSYTQMEYEYALSIGIPIIGFLHNNPGSIVYNKSESTQEGRTKLNDFRSLASQKMIRYWNSPQELGASVSRSIIKLIQSHPRNGWIKADENIIDISERNIMTNLQNEIDKLKEKNKDLQKVITDRSEVNKIANLHKEIIALQDKNQTLEKMMMEKSESIEKMIEIEQYRNKTISNLNDIKFKDGDSFICSFCERRLEDVGEIVKSTKVCICNECLELCNELIKKKDLKKTIQHK